MAIFLDDDSQSQGNNARGPFHRTCKIVHASSPDHERSEASTSPKGSSDSDASPKGSACDAVETKPSILEGCAAAGVWKDDAKTAAFAAARNG